MDDLRGMLAAATRALAISERFLQGTSFKPAELPYSLMAVFHRNVFSMSLVSIELDHW